MSERTALTKASETKGKSTSTKPRENLYQSMDSPVEQILQMQQTIGNQAVQRLIKAGTIQAKFTIGKPNDKYEQEADRIADKVMSMPEPGVQRQPEEEKEEIQTKPLAGQITPLVQRQADEEEEETIQAKQGPNQTPTVTSDIESSVNSLKGGGQPLTESSRAFFEPRFGADFSPVRVHTGSKAAETAKSINAKAFTTGKDIAFGSDQYSPGTSSGRHLLAHELSHVVQQKSGIIARKVAPEYTTIKDKLSYGILDWIITENEVHDAIIILKRLNKSDLIDTLKKMKKDGLWVRLLENISPDDLIYIKALTDTLKGQAKENTSLHQPIVGKAPRSAMNIQQFIKLVEAEEMKYPTNEQINTKRMITRIRKIFYDRTKWDKFLIKGTENVKGPYEVKPRERERYSIDLPGMFDLNVVKHEYDVKDKKGKTPEIAKNQEICLDDGSYLDIGHVFAGLDALCNPNKVDYHGMVDITKNVDAATWVGDLGSIMAEIMFKYYLNDETKITTSEAQKIINEYAPPQDMLGNIDAYVIGKQFKIGPKSIDRKVSEILREYYLGQSKGGKTPYRERRYSIFAQAIGLVNWNGTIFSNESEWVDYYTDEVNVAAAFYIGGNTEGLAKYPFALEALKHPFARKLVELFLKALKERIVVETK